MQAEVIRESASIDYDHAGDRLVDGMITYLNALEHLRPGVWPHAPVSVRITKQSVSLRVGQQDWHAPLGATHRVYFLLAYQHALLSLTGEADCHYPGLALLDFPLTLDDGTRVLDLDNFAMEPFITLTSRLDNTQLIAAGNAFEGLEGVNYTRLTRQWS